MQRQGGRIEQLDSYIHRGVRERESAREATYPTVVTVMQDQYRAAVYKEAGDCVST